MCKKERFGLDCTELVIKNGPVRDGAITLASPLVSFVIYTAAVMIMARLLTLENYGVNVRVKSTRISCRSRKGRNSIKNA